MARIRTLQLTEPERQALSQHWDRDERPFLRERSAAMLKIAEGKSPHWVAQHGLLKPRDPDTIYNWLEIYETQGLPGLIARQHGGSRKRGRHL